MEKIRVAVDAMGGDHAPEAPVKGSIEALKKSQEIKIIFLGKEELIRRELQKCSYSEGDVEIVPCSEVIEMAEPPVAAISHKKDSSIVRGMLMLRKGEADAFVSAGITGAVLVGGQVLVGRLRGVERPPLCCLIPTEKGMSLLLDCGANVDARPSWLLQFAQMGSIYAENILKIDRPRVAIVNIGAEEEKGNALVKETFPCLKACPSINFTGSIEARDISAGYADVIVADAFVGNVILKEYEGVAGTFRKILKESMTSSFRSRIGSLLVLPAVKKALKAFDASVYGGAPLLGLKGLVIKTHGSSESREFCTSVLQCLTFYRENINGQISEALWNFQKSEK